MGSGASMYVNYIMRFILVNLILVDCCFRTMAPRTMKRSRRLLIKNKQSEYVGLILQQFDVDKTGTLNREEVYALCMSIVSKVAPDIGVLDSDVDLVMRLGGDRAKAEVNIQEIPVALSAVLALKTSNVYIHELFVKYDVDHSNSLPKDELSNLLTELNEDIIPNEEDIDFIMKQCDISGDGAIQKDEIKAAIMGWYCLAEEVPMPASVEEAKSRGYTDDQINNLLNANEAGYNDTQIADYVLKRTRSSISIKEEDGPVIVIPPSGGSVDADKVANSESELLASMLRGESGHEVSTDHKD